MDSADKLVELVAKGLWAEGRERLGITAGPLPKGRMDFRVEARKLLTPPIEQSGLAGEWSIGETDDNRIYIESDDFTHDVRLYVDGDFRDLDQRRAYVERILTALTADNARDEALEEAAKECDEFEAQENGRAWDKRQEGRDDNFNCARASAATRLAKSIRSLKGAAK